MMLKLIALFPSTMSESVCPSGLPTRLYGQGAGDLSEIVGRIALDDEDAACRFGSLFSPGNEDDNFFVHRSRKYS